MSRLAPVLDADSAPFWDACRQHRLVAQRCGRCGQFRWPPQGVCPNCASWEFAWQELSGRGHVAAYVVAHRAFDPAFSAEVPYVIAHVSLDGTDDRVIMLSNLVAIAWEQVRVGLPVQVYFEDDAAEGSTLPLFRPAPDT